MCLAEHEGFCIEKNEDLVGLRVELSTLTGDRESRNDTRDCIGCTIGAGAQQLSSEVINIRGVIR